MKFYSIIPARSGSVGVKHKNIKPLGGIPLIAHTINASLKSMAQRTIVSTDSKEYADIAKSFGAEVPFLRPSEISGSTADDKSFLLHYILFLGIHKIRKNPYSIVIKWV